MSEETMLTASEMQWLRALLIKTDELEAIMDELPEDEHAYGCLERLRAAYRTQLRQIEREMLQAFAVKL